MTADPVGQLPMARMARSRSGPAAPGKLGVGRRDHGAGGLCGNVTLHDLKRTAARRHAQLPFCISTRLTTSFTSASA